MGQFPHSLPSLLLFSYPLGLFRVLSPITIEFRSTHCSTRDRFLSLEVIHSESGSAQIVQNENALKERERERETPFPRGCWHLVSSGCCLLNSRLPHPPVLLSSPLLCSPERVSSFSLEKLRPKKSHGGDFEDDLAKRLGLTDIRVRTSARAQTKTDRLWRGST